MYTKHAQKRMQQRCIPTFVVELLMNFGDDYFDGRGAIRVLFSKASIVRMQGEFGRRFVEGIKKYLNVYLIESASDGCVITCAHKTKRHRRR